jgi:hypothetical protein
MARDQARSWLSGMSIYIYRYGPEIVEDEALTIDLLTRLHVETK